MTVCFSARSSIVSSHWAARPATPWIRTIGGPSPAMLKFTRWPCRRTSTRSMVGRARTPGCERRCGRCLVAGEVAVIAPRVLSGWSVRDTCHEIARNLRTFEMALSRQLPEPAPHPTVDQAPRRAGKESVFDAAAAGGRQVARGAAPERAARQRPGRALKRLGGHHSVKREPVLVRGVVDRGADVAGVDRGHADRVAVLDPQRGRISHHAAL